MRHWLITMHDPRAGVSISTHSHDYSAGTKIPLHAHGADQLIYASKGVMEICAENKIWLIPPHLAVWIPSRTRHRIRMRGAVSMRTLYLRRGLARETPANCSVLYVSSFLRELVLESVRIGELRTKCPLHCALRDLIVSQLQEATTFPIFVTMPTDTRAVRVAEPLVTNEGESRSLRALCKIAGTSVRTMERIFQTQVGMTFGSWRRQVRLMKAIELLVEGNTIKEVSARVGYQQPSAFVEMFRKSLGSTPRAWALALRDRE